MNIVAKAWTFLLLAFSLATLLFFVFQPEFSLARNIIEYKNTLSDSAPSYQSNQKFSFKVLTNIDPGGYIEITPPDGFEILGTSTFAAERNVELYVNGVPRNSSPTISLSNDLVEVFPGSPGMIRYTLNPTSPIYAGSELELKIGNNTSKSLQFSQSYSTTTGTTTIEADIEPIVNAPVGGTKRFQVDIYSGGDLVANAGFLVALVEKVGLGPIDTTEEIPPYRFNGSPTSTVTGVTLSVEIFLETDELAICKYSTVPGVSYGSMTNTFDNTGLIYHTQVVAIIPNSLNQFYIRCMDDEGNVNTDDYLIEFAVSAIPTGTSNTEGDVSGDGTGSGNEGTGSGSGSGGETGNSSGEAPNEGGSAGTGGSGGGGGGGTGSGSGSSAGGGFESDDAAYPSGEGLVTITGYAFPRSDIVALVDGNEAVRGKADAQGRYSIDIGEIARGAYTFGVYAIDSAGVKSSTFSTSFTVTGSRTSALSNINIAPSIKVTPDPVQPGTNLRVTGFALPNATVTVENEKDKSTASRKSFTTTSDGNGAWSLDISTNGFTNGTYKIRAKAEQVSGVMTNFSNYTLYGVGQAAVRPINADLNRDGKVNLIDFSILLFWWNTDGGDSDPSADINSDTKVNLTDFSILLFNWTG